MQELYSLFFKKCIRSHYLEKIMNVILLFSRKKKKGSLPFLVLYMSRYFGTGAGQIFFADPLIDKTRGPHTKYAMKRSKNFPNIFLFLFFKSFSLSLTRGTQFQFQISSIKTHTYKHQIPNYASSLSRSLRALRSSRFEGARQKP